MQTLLSNFPAVRLALAAVVTTSLSLTGCLSGGGGSSSDGAATVEEPTDLRTTLAGHRCAELADLGRYPRLGTGLSVRY